MRSPGATVSEPLGKDVLATIARAGLVLPRPPFPGQRWQPRTPAEQHLLRQARALDVMRRQLLAEIGRLQAGVGHLYGKGRLLQAEVAELEETVRDLGREREPRADLVGDLSPAELEVLVSAATGESGEEFARRMCINPHTVKTRRRRAIRRLGARSFTQAVAIVVAAGRATTALGGGAP